jgi:hypothetical protein
MSTFYSSGDGFLNFVCFLVKKTKKNNFYACFYQNAVLPNSEMLSVTLLWFS